ncbi:hypothetical protein V8G54_003573 [Vigna mungo]|uniref:Secreted protein n=1 Tax=Vigna mungo TaxID=3915 RepID=A0AAQ3SA96_VIGMU
MLGLSLSLNMIMFFSTTTLHFHKSIGVHGRNPCGVSNNRSTAHGAIGVRSKPGVNARQVKSVVTLRQKPETFVLFKLAQTNGTFRPFNQAFIFLVLANGDGTDH